MMPRASSHFVVVPLPIYGHIFPMLHFSLQLASIGGNKVSFIATGRTKTATLSFFESRLTQLEVEDPQALRANVNFEFLPDEDNELLRQGGEPGIMANLIWMCSQIKAVTKVVDTTACVSCVILDFILDVPFKEEVAEVADKRGFSVAIFWTASTPWLLLILQVRHLVNQGFVPLASSNALSVVSGLVGFPPLCNYKDIPACLLKPTRDNQIENIDMCGRACAKAFVLMNTITELDNDSLVHLQQLRVNLVNIGPLLPLPVTKQKHASSRAPGDAPLLSWLDGKSAQSVLYICFGTLAENSPEQLHELACALEELVDQCFAWVLRQPQQLCLSQDFEQKIAGRGMIVPWCSQLEVLSHPSVGGFLTHCGWNSILESLSCGVPMIGWPSIAEQSLNAKFLEDVWKVGTRIVPINPDGSNRLVDISASITLLMKDEQGREMRHKACKHQKDFGRSIEVSTKETMHWVNNHRFQI